MWQETEETPEKVLLERIRFGLNAHLSKEFAEQIHLTSYIDAFTQSVALKFQADIFGQKLEGIQYPKNWIEAFKERWFPHWLLKKYPVQYTVMDIHALYPHLLIPGEQAVYHIQKRM